MLVFLLGDRTVQHTVDEALDGGHRRAQFVGDVAHELPAGIVDGLQPRGHVVEGRGKVSQFHAAVHRGAGGEIPAAQLAGGVADGLDGAGDPPGQHPAQQAAQQQDRYRRDAEHHQHVHDVGPQGGHGAGRKEVAHRAVDIDAPPGGIVFIRIDAVQRAGDEQVVAHVHLVQHLLGDPAVGEIRAFGVQQHAAVLRRDEHHRPGGGVEQFVAAAGTLGAVVAQGPGDDVAGLGKAVGEGDGAVQDGGERRAALIDEVGGRERRLDGAHDAETQHQHRRDGGKELPADRMAAVHSLTSNL